MRFRGWRFTVFLMALGPAIYWCGMAAMQRLGPDPGKILLDGLGQSALCLLLITLCMTPLQLLSGWSGWLAVRRQLGLWAFAYATLHFLGYLVFILGGDLQQVPAELRERPYILVGFLALCGLALLAATSNRASVQLLGRRWKKLHRLVYPILLLVLVHFLWVVRSDVGQWLIYAMAGFLILAVRVPAASRRIKVFAARRAGRKKDANSR